MSILQSIQNVVSRLSDVGQSPLGDIVGSITDNPALHEVQEHIATVSEQLESGNTNEQGRAAASGAKNRLGL